MFLWNSELESTASKGHVCSVVLHCLLHIWKRVVFSSWFSYLWSHVEGSNDFSPYHSWNRHHHCALFCGLTCSHHPLFSTSFCSYARHWIALIWWSALMDGWRDFGHLKRSSVHLFSPQSLVCRQRQWCKDNDTFRFILSKCRFSLVGNIKSPLP